MGYKCTFMDNEAYTAQDVNEVFSHLTSSGVCFSDTGNALSDLNDAQAQAVTEGVMDRTSCQVIKENGVYKISKGVCFMADGSTIIFDDAGQEITPISETVCYVYLKRNRINNCIDIVVSETAGGEDCVMLAEIDKDGNIKDRRKFSRSKVMLGAANTLRNFTQEIIGVGNLETAQVTIPDVWQNYTYFIVWDSTAIGTDGGDEGLYATRTNIKPFSEDGVASVNVAETRSLYTTSHIISAQRDGNDLILKVSKTAKGKRYTINFGVI